MKTKLNLTIGLSLLSMLLVSNSFAQKDVSRESAYRFSPPKFDLALLAPIHDVMSNEDVNKKVLKHFNKSFRNAENIKWERLDDNFLATFVVKNVTTKSLFDERGNLVCRINYISEKQLPADIKNIVTNAYRKYTITSVAGILQDNRHIWIVKLANETNYVAARVEDGEIEEIENFLKAN